ncbi:MAG: rod shape-determining protein MreC [Chloroflexota bacterium]|jgi:rod shape-determining protein MreC|nr:rod shape-determining protein MreC [Chloroflexota bacterium]
MMSLFATRASRRRAVSFTILLSVSLILMAISSSPGVTEFQSAMAYALRPIQGAVHNVADSVANAVAAIGEIQGLHSDNAALRRENERLTADNIRAKAIESENEQLTALLQLRSTFKYQTAAAEVIARESSEARRSITISKGTDDGIAKGDVVIAEGGALVGRVSEVGPDFATVTLISDRSSIVTGETETSTAQGQVVGQLGGTLIMQNIDSTEKVQPGEQVLTPGIELAGGIRSPYPKGLVIGEVTDVRKDPNSVVQTAYLLPTTDLDKVGFVLVILDYAGGLPGVGDTPVDCSQPGPGGALPGGDQPCIEPSKAPAASPLLP